MFIHTLIRSIAIFPSCEAMWCSVGTSWQTEDTCVFPIYVKTLTRIIIENWGAFNIVAARLSYVEKSY
jgi:hypothetical protein